LDSFHLDATLPEDYLKFSLSTMTINDITLVLGIDKQHLSELKWTWPTWIRFKPEIKEMPTLVFYDPDQVNPERDVDFLKRQPHIRFVPWTLGFDCTQREKMITAWLHIPAKEVKTSWYLKLDTDAIAVKAGGWIDWSWFAPNSRGQEPVFVSPPWEFSKPRYVIDLLDNWGDSVPSLKPFKRLDIPYSSQKKVVFHPRIISWLFFCKTTWTREMVAFLGKQGRLPYPSQDTYLFYCAKRSGQYYVRVPMNQYGWIHRRMSNIIKIVTALGIKPIV
jgi:hypothetical protein